MRWLWSCCIALVLAPTLATAEKPADLIERLHRAEGLSSLDDPALKPWHLKISFQLFDAKGQPAESGTIEEWWQSSSSYKIVYASPSYSATVMQTKGSYYETKDAGSPPYLLDVVLKQVVHPMPSPADVDDSRPEQQKQKFGKIPLECVMLSQDLPRAVIPLGLFPTYCFDPGENSLRAAFNFGSQLTVRNQIGRFQQREVAIEQMTSLNSVNAISGHIDKLEAMTFSDSDFVVGSDLEAVGTDSKAIPKVGSGIMQGMLLTQPRPNYPQRAKGNHVSGAVVMRARIGQDGHIHSLKLTKVVDPDLAIAALEAVRKWTYKPYILNGKPVEVDTTITMNFNFGGG